jgi:GcrA cell cycle regulator
MYLWTDERIEALKKYWPTEMPAAEIAEKLGAASKSAVIGKAHRLGLATRIVGRKATSYKPSPRKGQLSLAAWSDQNKRAIQAAGGRDAWIEKKLRDEPVRKPIPMPRPRTDLTPPVGRVAFADLEPHHCRWPVGEPGSPGFAFCGEPKVLGQSYCSTCCQRSIRQKDAA